MAVRASMMAEIGTAALAMAAVDEIARGAEHVDVVADGKPVAVVISVEDYRRYRKQDEERRRELEEAFTAISQAFADVPQEEIERELEKARVEYRAEKAAERAAVRAAREE